MPDDVAAQEEVGSVPCERWHEAGGMLKEWQKFTSELVTALLIRGFCGRGAFGGTPTGENRFTCMPAVNHDPPPYMASNPFLAKYVGSFRR